MDRTTLALSLGTRRLGIAISRNGDLVFWNTKSFPQKWSPAKLRIIARKIEAMINKHSIELLAIKVSLPIHSSPAILKLQENIQKLASQKEIELQEYSIDDLKTLLPKDYPQNREGLKMYLANLYPELHKEFSRENLSSNGYHQKVFEAVGLIELCRRMDGSCEVSQ